MENKVKAGIKKALIYAVLFAVILSFPVFICLTKNRNIFEIFANAVMPIYMAAITLGLYPLFRYINRGCKVFSALIFGFCAVIGVPVYILVGVTCGTFAIGSGLAYIIYGYAFIVVLAVICICDTLISLIYGMIKRK